jgi:hypothetical protein
MLKTFSACPPVSGSITCSFRTPICGLARKIHEIVCRIPGMISGTSEAANMSGLSGTSVRTIRKARLVPSVIETAVDPNANTNEFTAIVVRPTLE